MKLDNFEIIQSFLKEDDPEYFYEIQILRRGKDHPNLPAANWCIKSMCVHGKTHLLKYMDEIKLLCETFKARAYISLQRKSNRKCIEKAVQCFAERLYNQDNKKPEAIWWHAVGVTVPEEKIWVIDLDTKNMEDLHKIVHYVENKQPYKAILGVIPTLNGFHIVCHPFDNSKFLQDLTIDSEIKKHGLTLLYCNLN